MSGMDRYVDKRKRAIRRQKARDQKEKIQEYRRRNRNKKWETNDDS